MTCPYLIGVCAKTKLPCQHCRVDGECDEAVCINAVVPTWDELVDIYTAATNPSTKQRKGIVSALRSLTSALGVSMTDKVTVTDEQFDALYAKLLGVYTPWTIASYFSAYKACTSNKREMRMAYKNKGKSRPEATPPTVSIDIKQVEELTDAQRLAISDKMSELRRSGSKRDIKRFIWMWFASHFGVRMADIEKLKWSCLKLRSNGGWWLDYVPSKTARKCKGRRAGGPIEVEYITEILPYIGKPEEYVIERGHTQRKNWTSHGEYVGMNSSLRDWLNAFMHSIGVKSTNAEYLCRKDCSARMMKKYGMLAEAQMLGHTPTVARDHYVNFNSLEFERRI